MSQENNSMLPHILVIGLNEKDGKDIIKGIIGSKDLQASPENNYLWSLDNKYYTCDVNFIDTKDIKDLNPSILNAGEALLLYIDPSKKDIFEEITEIIKFLESWKFEVQLLIADRFKDDVNQVSKVEALTWCINHGWELVELEPESTSDYEDEEDDFVDSWGYQRIKQALNAHIWSNLTLKSKKDDLSNLLQAVNLNVAHNSTENIPYSKLETCDDGESQNVDDDFSNLLSSLNDMKEKAESLPTDERKVYAEKVAIAFWKSIGGDEEEIRGLESDDGD